MAASRFGVWSSAALAAVVFGLSVAPRADAADPRSSRFCSSCHGEIKKQWEVSSMARSWTNPVFQAFLADAKASLGPSIQANCISCHAPLASVTGDQNVDGDINQEGVTCNFCHNVTAVDVSPKAASYT
ncbi:MAG: multiheme c-type cytochrome, partial [Candidatus Eiseniibacteriota bacterium]